jgi:hypothetical protein
MLKRRSSPRASPHGTRRWTWRRQCSRRSSRSRSRRLLRVAAANGYILASRRTAGGGHMAPADAVRAAWMCARAVSAPAVAQLGALEATVVQWMDDLLRAGAVVVAAFPRRHRHGNCGRTCRLCKSNARALAANYSARSPCSQPPTIAAPRSRNCYAVSPRWMPADRTTRLR